MAHRPSSGSSTRSRRDEVWEMKRQRFLAKQGKSGYAGSDARSRPPALGQEMHEPAAYHQAAPPSPLSQLVSRGYAHGSGAGQQPASLHQPYGDRPSSGSAPGVPGGGFIPQHQGSYSGGGGGGFDAGIAGQWSANVQQTRDNQQNRHDPSVAGPHVQRGGTRVTQAPGGGANIDLSWGGGAARQAAAQAPPPRMQGGTPSGSSMGSCRQQPGGTPSGGSAFGAPWGRDDDNLPSRQPRGRREACPFGTASDAPAGTPQGRREDAPFASDAAPMRAPVQQARREAGPFATDAPAAVAPRRQREACPFAMDAAPPRAPVGPRGGSFGGEGAPAGGFSGQGRDAGAPSSRRPPGGASQVVFG